MAKRNRQQGGLSKTVVQPNLGLMEGSPEALIKAGAGVAPKLAPVVPRQQPKKPNAKKQAQQRAATNEAKQRVSQLGVPGGSGFAQQYVAGGQGLSGSFPASSVPTTERPFYNQAIHYDSSQQGPTLDTVLGDNSLKGRSLGSLVSEFAPSGSTMQQALAGLYNLAQTNPQDFLLVQQVLTKAGYLDPEKTSGTGGSPYGVLGLGDQTWQSMAAALTDSFGYKNGLVSMLANRVSDPNNTQGQKYWAFYQTIQGNTPITTHGQNDQISAPASLADQVRTAAHGAGEPGSSVDTGMAGQDPNAQQTAQFVAAAQQFQRQNPAQVTTQYDLGPVGTMRYPMEKGQTVVGGADSAAMDQFAHNWVIQNMGPQVAATGAANLLSAFNQLLGLQEGA